MRVLVGAAGIWWTAPQQRIQTDSAAVAVGVLLARRSIGSGRRGWWVGGRASVICAAERSGAMRAGSAVPKEAAAA